MSETVYGNESNLWPVDTIFIAGNSMINGTHKKRLSKKYSNVKIRYFDGALVSLIRKKPSALTLHVSTNNTVSDSSKDILKKTK